MAEEVSPLWERWPGESLEAYGAFHRYLTMETYARSIDAAYRAHVAARSPQQARVPKRAAGHWTLWSTKFEWLRRAQAYDDHLAAEEREQWERRRRRMRERDWTQAEQLRDLVDQALPHANQFIHSESRVIPGTPADADGNGGEPTREIITISFDITALARVLDQASRLQRLATDEPTERISYQGAVLDALIERELAGLLDARETGVPPTHPGAAQSGDEPPTGMV